MIDVAAAIANIAAIPKEPFENDYLGSDGLIYCGDCHTRKQYRVQFNGRDMIVPVMCRCAREKFEAEKAECRKREEFERIQRAKATCIHDRALLSYTFDQDDGSVPQMKTARRYVETWPKRKANNEGLLLWGNVGTGKTFYAACIANALIDQGVPVLMTNFSKVLNKLTGLYSDEKNEFIASMMRYQLLIIDDFGMERGTEFALEQVFNVIDERYKTKLPLIVTTNLSLGDMQKEIDLGHRRIYDRVLSMCVPIRIDGPSHRNADRVRKLRSCKELFEEGEENEQI